jgi:hypothetical protein
MGNVVGLSAISVRICRWLVIMRTLPKQQAKSEREHATNKHEQQ